MKLLQRLAKLEAITEADKPKSCVIIYDAKTGTELTERPNLPSYIVLLPHNGRNPLPGKIIARVQPGLIGALLP